MNKGDATRAYAKRRNDIARLIDVLQMELDSHNTQFANDPNRWGAAGDLGCVRDRLIDLVAFISQMEREDVERFLAEAE